MSKHNSYTRMLQFIKPFYGLAALTLSLTLLVVVLEGLTLWFTGSLLDMIFKNNNTLEQLVKPEFSWSEINAVLKYYTWDFLSMGGSFTVLQVLKKVCLLIPILFLFKDGIQYLRRVMMGLFNLRVIERMRNDFYQHVLALPMSFYDKHKTGNITSFLVQDLNVIKTSLTQSISLLIMEPFKIILFFSILLIINAKLTFLILITYPLIAYVIGKAGKVIKRRSLKMLSSFSELNGIMNETVSGVRLVKTFHGEEYEQGKFTQKNREYTRKAIRANIIASAISPFNEFVSLTLTSALLWYGGKDVLTGESSFTSADFLRYILILFSAYTPIKKLVNVHAVLQAGLAASERVFSVFDITKEEVGNTITQPFSKEIEISNLSFSYPDCEDVVLKDINFAVKKGQTVALVGSSGSGKSTILDLLPRYYEISPDTIKIDGISTTDMSLYSLRSLFGVVSQDTTLFDDSVAVNVSYGATPDYNRISAAIEAANATEFIDNLPEGIKTVVGERGVSLSGGQRQRLAIARALYKNPEILILDEATSALDTESEKLVQEAIDNLIQNRTTIVVAHRLSTIRNADKIIVLDKGRIVEEGNHDDLLQRNGRYRELHDIQFGNSGAQG